MNQEAVRERLMQLHGCSQEFTVVFSGKKSARVNGLYVPARMEILIHNRNFNGDDGKCNENLLMYTAIHELAHHICFTELGQQGSKSHTQLFWSTFHDLLNAAEDKGLYALEVDDATQLYIDRARELSRQIAALQRELGEVLSKINESCHQQGLRAEDVIERKVQISRKTMHKAVTAHVLDLPEDVGCDVQAAIIEERNPENREEILAGGKQGKTIAQLKRPAGVTPEPKDPLEKLAKERGRLETTIRHLEARLAEVVRQLEKSGQAPPDEREIIHNRNFK
jgi:type IV secretory pathway VirJ component